jgi:hypothetical protein
MISHKDRFIYTKVAKSGSTSIQNCLLSYNKTNVTHLGHYHIQDDISHQTNNYFKFTFVRNPWDRCVSKYHWVVQEKDVHSELYRAYMEGSFKEFLINDGGIFNFDKKLDDKTPYLNKMRLKVAPYDNQLDWISDEDGNILTDYIGKLENAKEDFGIVCDKIGIPRQRLPHKNKTKHKHYTEYYDDETKQIVAEKYAKDIEYFGYEFGE